MGSIFGVVGEGGSGRGEGVTEASPSEARASLFR